MMLHGFAPGLTDLGVELFEVVRLPPPAVVPQDEGVLLRRRLFSPQRMKSATVFGSPESTLFSVSAFSP